jgi:predicted nucleotide-binding protein
MAMKKAIILLADNNIGNLEGSGRVLRRESYEVIEASSFEKAREEIENPKIDLAILDLRLVDDGDPSDMSGLDLAARCRGRAPIIILSGKTDETAGLLLRLEEFRRHHPDIWISYVDNGEKTQVLLDEITRALIPKIFVVHGRDDVARLEVVNFLKTVRLLPVVLREQPGSGRTIIEKFEDYSNVSYAVVIMTPDDVGGLQGEKSSRVKLKSRARQNVILELGFFLGALGGDRVAVLSKQSKEEIEVPSDYNGVQYHLMDPAGNWRFDLAREMEAVDIRVDLNKIVRGAY